MIPQRAGEGGWKTNLKVVLVAPRNPLNIGAAARATANFGFSRFAVVNPYEVAFREARSAAGAAALLAAAEEHASVASAIAGARCVIGTASLGHREMKHRIDTLPFAARRVRTALAGGEVALLFGSEKFGLSNEDLDHCHWLLRIPTDELCESMNLGQAVAVCLYELARSPRAPAAPRGPRPATAGELEQLHAMLIETLEQCGYLNPVTAASTRGKIRRLLLRLHLIGEDARVGMGMLRQLLWALRR
ncbi:MAG: RNA methyltransferase [Bryobacterales bacterium]|nr:RNA methyltransferase [Bryobacterales bacterium]